MKRKFFIFSLPRSGSSWLSQFLSMPGCYCYHEPFADLTYGELEAKWDARPESVVGAIDTSAHQRSFDPVDVDYIYTLHRHKYDIESSLRRKGWVLDVDAEIKRLPNHIPIYHHWLCEISYLENIWASITGGLPFDRERAERLIEMNIQRSFASVAKRVASKDAQPHIQGRIPC